MDSIFFSLVVDFSHDDYQGPPMKKLLDIIEYVKLTALLNLYHQGCIHTAVIEAMAALNPRRIIFLLSNPILLSECEFHEAVKHGTILFASSSPFPEMDYEDHIVLPRLYNRRFGKLTV
jgi:malate dehydrogenase (oxaloacetate-decarboxylating)(NADP+)